MVGERISMLVYRFVGVAAAALVAIGVAGVPTTAAAPATVKPGDPCQANSSQPDGMWCDMQAGRWLSKGPKAALGQPCSPTGDVRLANGEDVAHCAQTSAGAVWRPGLHD
jgi:hypothetical protein